MKDISRRHRILSVIGALGLVVAFAVIGMGIYFAGEAGQLPWQEDPTRIPITPFAGIDGFSVPTKIPTSVAGSPAAGTPTP